MKGTTAKSRSPRRRREICRSFTCMSPWTIFLRWSNGGKSRIGGNLAAERKSDEDFSDDIGKEGSPNIGVGFGLIFLVRNELNKMVELRTRVESLLQHFESEIENHDDKQLMSISSSSLPKTLQYAEEHDDWSECSSRADDAGLRMDQLEAELEAEFDHLQLHDPDENAAGEGAGVLEYMGGGGVSARDLERRLQQVLQQERIKELESSLQRAMQLLKEKETQLSLLHTFTPASPPSCSTSNN